MNEVLMHLIAGSDQRGTGSNRKKKKPAEILVVKRVRTELRVLTDRQKVLR